MFDTVDTTICPDCNAVADIIQGEYGLYVSCSLCGRTSTRQYDTIEEAVATFKDISNVEYQ